MKISLLILFMTTVQQCRTQDRAETVILNCPDDFEVLADPSHPLGFATWTEPTTSDVTGRTHRIYRSYRPSSMLPVGENDVIYVFSDENDNRATCTFKVTVTSVDTTPPVVYNCPEKISTTVEVGSKHAVLHWSEPSAMDNSGVVVLKERTHLPGQLFPVLPDNQMVRYTYTDPSMNEAYCTFNVLTETEDTTNPEIISCPNTVTREVELHSNGSYVEWTNPTAIDNSGTVNLISVTHSRGDFFPIGITKVEYLFGDSSGNSANCRIDVVVTEVDRMVPKISHCPNDIIAGVKAPSTTTTVHWTEPTASDNSGKALMTGRSNAPGSEFELGSPTEVIYQFSDQSGNTAYCSFDVMVINDTTKPSIIGCPSRIIRQVNRSEKGMRVTWEEPIAYDDTAYVEKMFNTHNSGDFFYIGSTGVEYVFKDLAGNTEECSFEVQITFVAEVVSSGNDPGGQSSQGMDPQVLNRLIMLVPMTTGTTAVLICLIIVIGVYRVKRARIQDTISARQQDQDDLVPRGPPYFVFRTEKYESLNPGRDYLQVGQILEKQVRPIAGHVGDEVQRESMKRRSKGAVNRGKSRKHHHHHQHQHQHQHTDEKNFISMRKANTLSDSCRQGSPRTACSDVHAIVAYVDVNDVGDSDSIDNTDADDSLDEV
ncbi:hyalin-like isoform X2 [Apostichopus japonicus]|uniref:hyalin-like isoform X2 n=1 Tax=Stichopus japonicus TaxID=307972 RepID=UPI003AB5B60F